LREPERQYRILSQPSTLNPQPQFSPGQRAWQRFRRNRAAVISAWYLVFLLLAIIAWPVILKISGGTFAQFTIPTSFPTRNLRRRARNTGSARMSMGATFFPAFCTARKFRCSSASSARA
jgi:hypothetical protein